MGLVVCPRHGTGFLFVCPHVAEAVRSGRPCPGVEYRAYSAAEGAGLEGIELSCWFCPGCVAGHALPPHGTAVADVDAFLDATRALYRPLCPGCFEDWRRAAGQRGE